MPVAILGALTTACAPADWIVRRSSADPAAAARAWWFVTLAGACLFALTLGALAVAGAAIGIRFLAARRGPRLVQGSLIASVLLAVVVWAFL